MKLDFDDFATKDEDVINLNNKGLRDDELDIISKVIEQSTVLEKLDLRGNHLTLDDGKLANAIAKNTT